MAKWLQLTEQLHDYVVAHGARPDDVVASLVAETEALGRAARMQLAPEQAAFLTLLTRIVDARLAVEVGTFTGLSSLAIARGMRPDGRLVCCDVSEEWTAIAKRHWAMAGVTERIDLRIGPAADTLRALADERSIDLALIDADKGNYPTYYEEIVRRLRPGGVVCVDNVLWGGAVADPAADDEVTGIIRAFNDAVVADERVDAVLLPIGDGLTIARRRA